MNSKKVFLVLSLLIFSNFSSAQFYNSAVYKLKMANRKQTYSSYFEADYSDYQNGFIDKKTRKSFKLKEEIVVYTDNKNRQSKTVHSFNNYGQITHSTAKNYTRTSTYFHDTIEASRFIQRKRKNEEFKLTFNNDAKILIDERFKNGKLISKTTNTFEKNNLVSAHLMHKGKIYQMKYSYNEEGKLKKAEFFKKTKLKESWVYECKPEGQIVASNKTELISSKCEYREESADGSYALFTRTIRAGKPFLEKNTFNKDSVLFKKESFSKDTLLRYSWTKINQIELEQSFRKGKLKHEKKLIFNDTKSCIEKLRSKHGKEKSKEIYTYDVQGNQIRIEKFWKGKFKYLTTKEFDEKRNTISEIIYRKKDKKITSKRLKTYNENNMLTSIEYYKNGKFINKREFEYIYF